MVVKKKVKKGNGLVSRVIHGKRSIGERSADAIAKWAGSWTFIILFLTLLVVWMAVNVYGWVNSWDPYPFILLNLVLSCISALQAPVILMSQNRQGQKDRMKIEYDYKVNRKAERMVEEILERVKRIESKKRKTAKKK